MTQTQLIKNNGDADSDLQMTPSIDEVHCVEVESSITLGTSEQE